MPWLAEYPANVGRRSASANMQPKLFCGHEKSCCHFCAWHVKAVAQGAPSGRLVPAVPLLQPLLYPLPR